MHRLLRHFRELLPVAVVAGGALLCRAVAVPPPAPARTGASFVVGDPARLTRGETLLFNVQNLVSAPKGEEFEVLKPDPAHAVVYVAFYKPDGSPVAATLPIDALEPATPDAWTDLRKALEAFRDLRADEMRRRLARASLDPQQRPLATALGARINAALLAAGASAPGGPKPAFLAALQGLRDTAEQLAGLGDLCLAVPIDEAVERLATATLGPSGASSAPASKIDRKDLAPRVTAANLAVVRCRQAMALRRLVEASHIIEAGLKAEPKRPELVAFDAIVQKGLEEAESRWRDANSMRRFNGGAVHALTALEHGLKVCIDHPKLVDLKKEMNSALEERTSPPVTPAFLAAAKVGTPPGALEEGRRLYTSHCTECHDLEMLDTRTVSNWQKAVAGMSRRAHMDEAQQGRIVDYIAAAINTLDSGKP